MKTLTEIEVASLQQKLGVKADGEWGPVTQGAFERWAGLSKVSPVKVEVAGQMSLGARLYAHAKLDEGLLEVKGPKSAARIAQAIKSAAAWLNPDDSETAWCGCIMGTWCREVGVPVPKECYRAKSWIGEGSIARAQRGDIVVIERGGNHHVALFHLLDGTTLWLFGGNQSDSVNLSPFSTAKWRVAGVRHL